MQFIGLLQIYNHVKMSAINILYVRQSTLNPHLMGLIVGYIIILTILTKFNMIKDLTISSIDQARQLKDALEITRVNGSVTF